MPLPSLPSAVRRLAFPGRSSSRLYNSATLTMQQASKVHRRYLWNHALMQSLPQRGRVLLTHATRSWTLRAGVPSCQAAMCRTRMHVKACSGTAGEPGSAAQSLFNISHAGFSSEAAAAEQPIAAGLNMMKGETDPPLLPDAEYPSWLWQLSEPQAMLSQLRRIDADEQSPEQVRAA